jgi:hypothetical protein
MRIHCNLLLATLLATASLLSSANLSAQACQFQPSDTPATGNPDPRPFGNGNPADPNYGTMRYQLQVPASAFGNQPAVIRELFVASAGSFSHTFAEVQVRFGHSPNPLGTQMVFNMTGFTARPIQYGQFQIDTEADAWTPLGMAFPFQYNPAFGSLVLEFFVRQNGALPGGTGNIGLRTDPSIPFVWTSGSGYNGTIVNGGGIKLRLCTDSFGTIEYGVGGCIGSNGERPTLSYGGSAQIGSTLQIQLSDAPAAATTLAVLAFSSQPRVGPFDLTGIGMTGCDARVFDTFLFTEVISGGTHQVPIVLPPGIPIGQRFWNQWFCLDLPANAFGLTASNFGRFMIGNQ